MKKNNILEENLPIQFLFTVKQNFDTPIENTIRYNVVEVEFYKTISCQVQPFYKPISKLISSNGISIEDNPELNVL